MPKIKISFYISGEDIDLDALTKELNLKPTRKRKKNEWPEASILAGIAKDAWEFQIEAEECKAVSIQFDKLQNILSHKVENIRKLSKKFCMKTSIIVVIEMDIGDGPEMILSKENIVFLSKIDAEIGFDIYIY